MSKVLDINEDQYKQSICFSCEYLISRVIVPVDCDEFDMTEEDAQGLLDDNGNFIPIQHNTCAMLGLDLTYVVLQCNKFRDLSAKNMGIFGLVKNIC